MKTLLWIVAILALILLAVVVVAAVGLWRFDWQMKRESDALLAEAREIDADVITEADIERLPEPVHRYMHYTGVVGRTPIRTALVQQSGGFRTAPEQSWMPFRATEVYSTNPAAFACGVRASPWRICRC